MSTEKTEQIEEQNLPPLEQFILPGDLLRKKRESLGYSQKEIADRLRLRISIIENIDDNNLDMGQVPTFIKGYLKSYAKAVSIDEREVLAAFDQIKGIEATTDTMQSFSRKTNREKHDSRIMRLTWGIFAIVAAISSLWWWQNQQSDQFVPSASEVDSDSSLIIEESHIADIPVKTPVGEPASPVIDRSQPTEELVEQPELAPVQLPVIEEETSASDTAAEESTLADEAVVEAQPSEPVVEVVAETTTQTTSAASGEQIISMSFSADCWVQVQDSTGKTLATGVKKQGRSFEISGVAPFNVILGAPEAVEMTLSSESVDLSGYTAGKVARFTLP
jgi:cytoskeleton protein RodZ